MMAGAVTVPLPLQLVTISSTNRRCISPALPPACSSFYIPSPSLYHHSSTRHRGNPSLSICRGSLNSSAAEEPEEIDEAFFYGDNEVVEDDSDDDDDEDTESSIDLLFGFFHSMFKKVSKRARKASRAVLPDVISPQLVSFAVDGVLLLASLSIVKALLEVVCTLGGTIFVVILLLRVIFAAVSCFQLNGNNLNKSGTSYSRTQPVT